MINDYHTNRTTAHSIAANQQTVSTEVNRMADPGSDGDGEQPNAGSDHDTQQVKML